MNKAHFAVLHIEAAGVGRKKKKYLSPGSEFWSGMDHSTGERMRGAPVHR